LLCRQSLCSSKHIEDRAEAPEPFADELPEPFADELKGFVEPRQQIICPISQP
jgi:hypothetical protein